MTGSTASEPAAVAAPAWPSPEAVRFTGATRDVRAAYEHPWLVRMTHWLTAISLFVLIGSGLQIFMAFPSFGPKIPQNDLLHVPEALRIGGWLGGALQWHFTFMWLFIATGIAYVIYQGVSGRYRMVLFTPRDMPGVWPMARHYFFFREKPPVTGPYNPLQKLAYTASVGFGAVSVLTGLVMFNPVQFSWLAWLMGGFSLARVWHFAAMCGFLAFIPGHLVMVAVHGWKNFVSMLVGWKRDPEYAAALMEMPVMAVSSASGEPRDQLVERAAEAKAAPPESDRSSE
jgi:Ni/Fe-hydrogenase b-type cytochrome subunit